MLLTIAGVASAVLAVNALYPAITRSSGAMVTIASKVDDQIKSQISIIHATGELDKDGVWQDTDSDGKFDIFIWVKNVGASRILGIQESDIYFGQQGNYARIPHQTYAGGQYPQWVYQVEGGGDWESPKTLKITIHYSTARSQGTYLIKVIIPNGVSDEDSFSL